MHRILISVLLIGLFLLPGVAWGEEVTIGLLMPIEHVALRKITRGFEETLKQEAPEWKVLIRNAQGDLNIAQTIVRQFKQQKLPLLVTIGTSMSQLTATQRDPSQGLLALAVIPESLTGPNMGFVYDEIEQPVSIDFFSLYFPRIRHLTLVHSIHENVLPSVRRLEGAARKQGITLQVLPVQQHVNLIQLDTLIDPATEGLIVLRDNFIVSGMPYLKKVADERNILLLSHDEGSIYGGADLALGISEADLGRAGAQMALAFLKEHRSLAELPPVRWTHLRLFYESSRLAELKRKGFSPSLCSSLLKMPVQVQCEPLLPLPEPST